MEQEVKRSKRTLSAEVTEALARELRRRRLQGLVAAYEQENGATSAWAGRSRSSCLAACKSEAVTKVIPFGRSRTNEHSRLGANGKCSNGSGAPPSRSATCLAWAKKVSAVPAALISGKMDGAEGSIWPASSVR